jgi:phosphoribosylformimino-5-aminoimidazole carboxamide ribotide isomerase
MEVIPVIDLKGGAVVHARGGRRDAYAPIVTPLARTSTPLDVVSGFLTLFPFRTIYVADLDAISGRAGDDGTLAAITAAFLDVTFWVDSGISDPAQARAWLHRHKRGHLVLGSESVTSLASLDQLVGEERAILSLDFRGGALLGPTGLDEATHLWPSRIIVMSLDRVGAGEGPDVVRLAEIGARAPDAKLYAAGGVRGPDDLTALMKIGISGALVATALHDDRINADCLAPVMGATREAKNDVNLK